MSVRKGLRVLAVTAVIGILGACGGGGGSKVENTVVSGVVSKGIFTSGTVKVYRVEADGSRGALLKEDAIKAGGLYAADLGSAYTGPIRVEAFGTYTDEATGTSVTIPESAALKAAVPSVATAAPTVVVTPLTDLAVRKATTDAGNLDVATIGNANAAVAALFGVDNIVTTKPVLFDSATMTNTATTAAQKKYTEVLALVSQYAANTGGSTAAAALESSLAELSSAITVTSTTASISSVQVAANLQSAVNSALANPNTSAVLATDATAKDNLVAVTGLSGRKIVSYTLSLAGVADKSVGGIQASFPLPSALALADGEISNKGIVVPVAAFSGLNVSNVKSNVLTFGLATVSTPLSNGQFATLYFNVPAATATPAPGEIVLTSQVTGPSGATLTGASITVAAGTTVSVN